MKPKISFIVIAHNKESYIAECLDSILCQTIDKEIIIVDDCSEDKTWEIIQQYTQKYPFIFAAQNSQNKGTIYTRIRGCSLAQGEYFIMIDADDKVIGNYEYFYYLLHQYSADILEFNFYSNKKMFLMQEDTDKIALQENNLLTLYEEGQIKNTLVNKLVSCDIYRQIIPLFNTNICRNDFSDVIYFLIHILSHSKVYLKVEKNGYFYYEDRGMTFHKTLLEKMKEYYLFSNVKINLEQVYGELTVLNAKNTIVQEQLANTYRILSRRDQETWNAWQRRQVV